MLEWLCGFGECVCVHWHVLVKDVSRCIQWYVLYMLCGRVYITVSVCVGMCVSAGVCVCQSGCGVVCCVDKDVYGGWHDGACHKAITNYYGGLVGLPKALWPFHVLAGREVGF